MAQPSSDTNSTDAKKPRVILVGIGGATCSGKTTLAKHLLRILPNSVIIHQDDFAPPQELVPFHPIYQVQDWDAPAGAISWPRMIDFLRHVKETGAIPVDHRSHDHLNEQKQVPLEDLVREQWKFVFENIQKKAEARGEKVIWGLVDGFLLYWHPQVIEQLDVRIFLRVPHDILKHRRHERHGYHTAEGSLWRDPPHYWEQIVWPAYIEANQEIFQNGDLENGAPSDKVKGLVLVEGTQMKDIINESCVALKEALENM
ncbi:P-loop containing nucleoside triphosphate hydrolase protein [Dendrothele bispora CBS 962.96]|uniref:P-loop containing nucleoside triphosphate hydrolase protein n=1 Tax=Dendrothele bispora (strain CBS 962.96) TaxID=1314807 RepID=A0A4S8MUP4_DENBC|nr:P-loop containing nucleoside triphosphate hydrolase protein [Dendrothele bispora CBS 962.96]